MPCEVTIRDARACNDCAACLRQLGHADQRDDWVFSSLHISSATEQPACRTLRLLLLACLLALPHKGTNLVAAQQQLTHQDTAHTASGSYHQHLRVPCLRCLKLCNGSSTGRM